VRDFREFEKRINDAIEELGGSVFPKLNWSAPKVGIFYLIFLFCKIQFSLFFFLGCNIYEYEWDIEMFEFERYFLFIEKFRFHFS